MKRDHRQCVLNSAKRKRAARDQVARSWVPPLNPLASGGFTFLELISVLSVLALIAAMVSPALCRTKASNASVQCLNNVKQLTVAWQQYAANGRDALVFAYGTSPQVASYVWVQGILDLTSPSAPDNWDYDRTLRKGALWPYCGNSTSIWRCPSDLSYAINAVGDMVPRVRSFSMSNWVGGNGDSPANGYKGSWGLNSPSIVYRSLSQMVRPGPARTFVLLDERYDSINDGYFVTQMDGYRNPATTQIVDYPGAYHNRGGSFSFADGHAEIHKWRDPRTTPRYSSSGLPFAGPSPNNQDVRWLQDHCSH